MLNDSEMLKIWPNHPEKVEKAVVPEKVRKKILVVDDEPDMMIFLRTLLDTGGFQSIAAENGTEGLKMAREETPALIILDIMMPQEGGAQMFCKLKQDETLKNIPVIMLSAIERKIFFHYLKFFGSTPRLDSSEPEAYLEKPPETEELLDLVQRLTQTHLPNVAEDE